jgi:predicted metalloprotease with PDZ domain
MERLRSKQIEPFDFERENMSDALWLGEGFTNYYGPLMVRRAGFITDEDFAKAFGGEIAGTILSPARRHGTPVTMSQNAVFFDGGTYSDPTNRQNTFLSYYTWGSVVACGLDLILREKYHLTLDDYMRALWRDFGSKQSAAWAPLRPYTLKDLEGELASLTKDAPFARQFFARYIEGSDVPDFASLLKPAGILVSKDSVATPFLAASLDNDTSAVFVNWSQEGGSAYAAGIASGDMIYSVDGVPAVSIDTLNAILARHKPGDVVQVDVKQRNVRRTIPMKLIGRQAVRITSYETAGLPVTDQMREFRKSWLGSKRTVQ